MNTRCVPVGLHSIFMTYRIRARWWFKRQIIIRCAHCDLRIDSPIPTSVRKLSFTQAVSLLCAGVAVGMTIYVIIVGHQ